MHPEGVTKNDEDEISNLHGFLGLVSEFHEFITNKGLEFPPEEIGDLAWYLGLISKGKSLQAICIQNIEKLKKRYPDKFSVEKALNRNIENEQRVFEQPQG